MKTLYTSTALALLFGLGAMGASLPASAAGEIVVAQTTGAETGAAAGTETEAATGADTGAAAGAQTGAETGGGGQGAESGESGAIHPMEVTGAEAQGALQCDIDGDGFVHVDEARACYEEHFGTISGGGSHLTMEQFSGGMTGAEDSEALYAEVDQDGDGQISREEWLEWRERGFAEATAGTEGRMAVEDYGRWHLGGATED